jgi:hypothetical protein
MTDVAQADPAPGAVPTTTAAPVALPPQDDRKGSETGHAVGLAAAAMAANVIGVVFTVVFTRVLGTDGYGSLAALINGTVILFVPGSALQVAAARAGALGRLGNGGELAATLDRWTRRLLGLLVAVATVSVVGREPLAALLDIRESWAAAAVPPTGVLWLLLCLQRGLLQSTPRLSGGGRERDPRGAGPPRDGRGAGHRRAGGHRGATSARAPRWPSPR